MNPPGAPESSGSSSFAAKRRAFRPLIIYLVFALPILGWDIHRRNAARTFLRADVNLEGKLLETPVQLEIDGKPASPDVPAPVGKHVIRISSRDTEAWETNKFIWYGDNPLGAVQLKRSRGELRVAVKPAPREIFVTGALTNVTSSAGVPTFSGLPVGDYTVRLRFAHFSRTVTATVARNTTTTLNESFAAGPLKLETQPAGGRYELTNLSSDAVQLSGEVPATVSDLPPGAYRLVLVRDGNYQSMRTITLNRDQTNQVREVFAYGQISVTTDPAGATVTMAGQIMGKTPVTLKEVRPGSHSLQAGLDGYQFVGWNVEVQGDQTITLTTNLVSVRYTEAMEQARSAMNGFSRDYKLALTRLAEALTVRPDDADALRLRSEAQYLLHHQEGRTALISGQLASAKQSVEAALTLKPGGAEALALRADIQQAERNAEERQQRLAQQKANEEQRRAAMEKEAAQQKAEEVQRRMAAEKEAARLMAEKEQQRMVAEKEAVRLKAEQEQRHLAAERIAVKQRREKLVADTFVAAVQKIPRGARPAWKTSASQAEVLAALARTLPLCAEKWKVINETKGDELVQQTFTGVGFLSSNQRALIQSAQMEGYTDVRMTLWFDNGKGLLGTVSPEGAGLIPETNGYLAEAFRKILEKEIGKPLK